MQHIFSIIMLFSWPLLIIVTYVIINEVLKVAEKKFAKQETATVSSEK